ncbi:YceI family protein [Sulfurimonas sp.]|uniref:YceI family protein n=1 Tax=Sulfurimonas sp. TaxID=2022749 RepID=UPI0025CF38F9|nr:YceI family protein [Sulfurimonas sp.]
MKKIITTLLVTTLGSIALFAGTYNVDTSHSHVGFKVKHMMISNVLGKFDTFDGSFIYDEKTKTITQLNGVINVNSINTANKKRDAHLKSAELFDAKQYPKITFTLSKIDGDDAYGQLTMHGVTKDVKLDFENNGMIKDPWGNTRVGLELTGKLSRKDYGITWNTILEAGGVAVGDTIKLDIQIEGILAK